MARASRVDVHLDLAAVPLLEGALVTAGRGLLSSLQPHNVRLRRAVANHDVVRTHAAYPLLFDPQTAGGLLASVPAAQADGCLDALQQAGYPQAAVVGEVEVATDPEVPVRIAT